MRDKVFKMHSQTDGRLSRRLNNPKRPLTIRSKYHATLTSLSISLLKHYVIASQSQRRVRGRPLYHWGEGWAITKESQRKASVSLEGGVIQLPGAPVEIASVCWEMRPRRKPKPYHRSRGDSRNLLLVPLISKAVRMGRVLLSPFFQITIRSIVSRCRQQQTAF